MTTFNCDISVCDSMCCRNCPVLTRDEVAELIANVKKKYDVDLDRKKYFRSVKGEYGLYFSVKMIKGQCIFLNREKRCRIYDCRPTLCELYPVIDVDAIDERCPGIRKNQFHEEILDVLKKRYEQEIDEKIKKEHTFMFV